MTCPRQVCQVCVLLLFLWFPLCTLSEVPRSVYYAGTSVLEVGGHIQSISLLWGPHGPSRTFLCLQFDFKVHSLSCGRVVSLTSCLELQLNNPEMVEGLVLINVNPCAEGWMDWAASKVSLGAWVSRGYPNLQRGRRARLCLEGRLQGTSPCTPFHYPQQRRLLSSAWL